MGDSPGLETVFVRLYLDRHVMKRLLNHFTAEQLVSNFVHLEQFK